MKRILLFMLMSVMFIHSGISAKPKNLPELKEAFVSPDTSIYNATDVFGILNMLMQYSEDSKKYYYEFNDISWKVMEEAILGNPEKLINVSPQFKWTIINGQKTVKSIEMYGSLVNVDFSYFENIESINLSSRNTTSIIVKNNKKLKNLSLKNVSISNVDLSQNTELVSLSYDGSYSSNNLDYIDLSKNVNLKTLKFKNADIKKIDVRNNKKLDSLYLDIKQMESLDLNENVQLKYLYFASNVARKLGSEKLDLSKNIYLKKLYIGNVILREVILPNTATLEEININHGNLTYGNISNLDLAGCTNLRYLYIGPNKISDLDLSNNVKLSSLSIEGNYLSKLDISHNSLLNYLDVAYLNLSELDISKNPRLESLYINNNQFKFSNLPVNKTGFFYYYDCQKPIQGGTVGYLDNIDISSEYKINNRMTTYKWYERNEKGSSVGNEIPMYGYNGTFIATQLHAGKKLVCKMTNPEFSGLTLEYYIDISKRKSN